MIDEARVRKLYEALKEELAQRGIDAEQVKEKLKAQKIETPSWGYGDAGTRFAVFHEVGAARNIYEKLEDAAMVHKLTGVAPSVAIHIPWDKVDDYGKLRDFAEDLGVKIGAVNPNLFEEPEYKYGSITNADPKVRKKALEHMLECVEIAKTVGSDILSLWFADGTDYPGQGSFRQRKRWAEECLREVYEAMPGNMRMLLEYKFFEPGFYHTDIADWGMACVICKKLGDRAQVLVDLGHHPLGTNIEHIIAFLIDEGKLGGFHFNNKKYADDDLTVGSINPYELFLIYNELVDGELDPEVNMNVAYMIDQAHITKPKIEAMLQSVDNIQVAYAKSLIVQRDVLENAQEANDVVLAEEVLKTAFLTDVRPIIWMARLEMGLEPDVIDAFRRSGYKEKIMKMRG